MSEKTKTLTEICSDVSYGYTASAAKNDTGTKFLRITDIVPDLINWETVPYCELSDTELKKFRLYEGDIVVARTGATTGYAKYIRKPPQCVFASYLVRFRVGSEADPEYIGHIVQSDDYKAFIKQNLGGAAQPNASAVVLGSFPIELPDINIQRHIAFILTQYDALIENNRRRIKILEEMAQSLYREWFVHFRFPGHEKIKMIDSPLGFIPEGWEIKKVSEIFEILGGGTPSKTEPAFWENGTINWYSPTDLTKAKNVFMEVSSEKITSTGLQRSSAKLFPTYSVMLTSRATIGVISVNTTDACTNQGFITCLPNQRFPLWILYHWLKENVETFISLGTGATFKEITKGTFKEIPLVLPTEKTVIKYMETAAPMMEQILKLEKINRNLSRTRDLLLPKLISGEIKLSANSELAEAA